MSIELKSSKDRTHIISLRTNSPVNEETGDSKDDERQAGSHSYNTQNWQMTWKTGVEGFLSHV